MAETPHPVDIHVGGRLKAGRAKVGVTQSDLADDLGISAQQVQKYENGTNRVSASKLFEIAQRLETTIEWFFDGLFYGESGDSRAPVMRGEEVQAFEPAQDVNAMTRALIAAFRALPDDDARRALLAEARARSEQT